MKSKWQTAVVFTTLAWVCAYAPFFQIQTTAQVVEVWPPEVREVSYSSAADGTLQPALFYSPEGTETRPLLVALHTWSGNYLQKMSIPYAEWCIKKGWIFIHPNFRGPNIKPEATGSDLVVEDIRDAVAYAKRTARVDKSRIYLVGSSGGGYTSLLMAGRSPEIWAGVSAWVPITDLRAWYYEGLKPGMKREKGVIESCGGIPEPGSKPEEECHKRSPLTYLAHAKGVPIDINAGILDGHTGSVPISHTLHAFNLLASPRDRVSDSDIDFFVNEAKVPAHLENTKSTEMYGRKKILFRRQSKNARVTIFDGGHEIIVDAALEWLSAQRKSR